MRKGVALLYYRLSRHIARVAGEDVCNVVFGPLDIPDDDNPSLTPQVTAGLVAGLKSQVDADSVKEALTANTHGIPDSVFEGDRQRYLSSPNLEYWLAENHQRAVASLEEHASNGELWFEQHITPAVVEWVRNHPEVLGGVLKGSRIHFTKIPFDPDAWLKENDPQKKRYLYCHCPLARESLNDGGIGIDADWCRCSAGFVKRRFDVAFDTVTDVEVLESVMSGGRCCRFSISIPENPDS